jgi:hypothetical protein
MSETRILNWQLIVPDEEAPLLLLPAGDESVPGARIVPPDPRSLDDALASGPYHGVIAPDLGGWGDDGNGGAASLLSRLAAAAPEPDGWVFASFANRRFPRKNRRRQGLRLGKALKVLRSAGLADVTVYVPLPSHRMPAWIVPVGRRQELDVFLRQMVFPYAPVSSRILSWLGSRAIQAGRRIALAAPHSLRVRFAPSYAIVARRPA